MERWTGITWNRGPAWRGTLDRHAWNTHTVVLGRNEVTNQLFHRAYRDDMDVA